MRIRSRQQLLLLALVGLGAPLGSPIAARAADTESATSSAIAWRPCGDGFAGLIG